MLGDLHPPPQHLLDEPLMPHFYTLEHFPPFLSPSNLQSHDCLANKSPSMLPSYVRRLDASWPLLTIKRLIVPPQILNSTIDYVIFYVSQCKSACTILQTQCRTSI